MPDILKPITVEISSGDLYEIRETSGADGITVRLKPSDKPRYDAIMLHMPSGNVVQISTR